MIYATTRCSLTRMETYMIHNVRTHVYISVTLLILEWACCILWTLNNFSTCEGSVYGLSKT